MKAPPVCSHSNVRSRENYPVPIGGRFWPRLMEWSPLSDTASKCHSGDASQPLRERSDRDEDYNCRRRPRKEVLPGAWCGRTRHSRAPKAAQAQRGTVVLREPHAVPDWDGGVLRRASLGTATAEVGTYGEADGTAVREALCQDQ